MNNTCIYLLFYRKQNVGYTYKDTFSVRWGLSDAHVTNLLGANAKRSERLRKTWSLNSILKTQIIHLLPDIKLYAFKFVLISEWNERNQRLSCRNSKCYFPLFSDCTCSGPVPHEAILDISVFMNLNSRWLSSMNKNKHSLSIKIWMLHGVKS